MDGEKKLVLRVSVVKFFRRRVNDCKVYPFSQMFSDGFFRCFRAYTCDVFGWFFIRFDGQRFDGFSMAFLRFGDVFNGPLPFLNEFDYKFIPGLTPKRTVCSNLLLKESFL